jgi:signal transduction histidine kinase
MEEVMKGTKAAIADIRRIVYALRPPALDDLGLVSALKEQALLYSNETLHITIDAPQQLIPLSAAVEVAIYRIVQEALTNVVRHANAQTCTVRLQIEKQIKLDICDDGQGIPEVRHTGVGLNSIHERTAELCGSCVITSTAQQGTRIQIILPAQLGDTHGKN